MGGRKQNLVGGCGWGRGSRREQEGKWKSVLPSERSLYVARERSQLATASRKELEELELITAAAVSVKNHTVPEQF